MSNAPHDSIFIISSFDARLSSATLIAAVPCFSARHCRRSSTSKSYCIAARCALKIVPTDLVKIETGYAKHSRP
ncbi:hypothetical protein NQZ79_g6447 [Umbelopsis isabellina]|nr:hypothetical protein NQZ79_g6447 [Umbelopsis isabellina]